MAGRGLMVSKYATKKSCVVRRRQRLGGWNEVLADHYSNVVYEVDTLADLVWHLGEAAAVGKPTAWRYS